MRDCRSRTGKAEAVHRRIRLADEAQSFIERCLTALIDGLAEQQNRTAIARGLCPQLRDSQCDTVQNGCPLIPFVQAGKLLGASAVLDVKGISRCGTLSKPMTAMRCSTLPISASRIESSWR